MSDRQVLLLLLEMFIEALGEYQRVCDEMQMYAYHDPSLAPAPLQPDLALVPVLTDLAQGSLRTEEVIFSPLHERPGLGEHNRDRGGVGGGGVAVEEENDVDGGDCNDNDKGDNQRKNTNTTTITTTTTNNKNNPASLIGFNSGEGDMDTPPPALLAGGLSPVRTLKDKGSSKTSQKNQGQGQSQGQSQGGDKGKGKESPLRSHRPSSPTPSSPIASPRLDAVPSPGPGAVSSPSPGTSTPGRSSTLSIKASLTHLR